MIRSIRFSLTLWYVGILAAILILFGWLLYAGVATNIAQDADELLALEGDGIAEAIFSFWRAEKEATGLRKPIPLEIAREIEEGRFPDLVGRWAKETHELEGIRLIRLLTYEGKPLAFSGNFPWKELPLTDFAREKAHQSQTVYETFNVSGQHFRLLTRPAIEGERILYLIQAALSLRHLEASLAKLRFWLLCLIPVTLFVTLAVGWFLATLALRPVGRMIAQVERIGVRGLDRRLDVPLTGDELERLAKNFNEMLSRLERSFRRTRQFSAAASHELRTPLTIMKGEVEVALRKGRTSEEYQQVLRTQLEAINEMIFTVEQLLSLARGGEGGEIIEHRRVELDSLARQVLDSRRPLAQKKQISLRLISPPRLPVQGEPKLLELLVGNLLDNAFKHSPSHGQVTLRLEAKGEEAFLSVQDSGPGIPPEEREAIFEKFFRRPDFEESGSSGLGLGLCRWIAEAHQGQIEVLSQAGRGATLRIRLPLASPAKAGGVQGEARRDDQAPGSESRPLRHRVGP